MLKRGYILSDQKSRRISDRDFERYDLILAMDRDNLGHLRRRCAPEHLSKVQLFMRYAGNLAEEEIPDPYYGDAKGFERVLDLCEAASAGLIQSLEALPLK